MDVNDNLFIYAGTSPIMSDALRDKIHLLHGGDVEIPEGFRNENIVYRDGEPYSITIAFEGTRARKKISDKGQSCHKMSAALAMHDTFLREGDMRKTDWASYIK